MKKSLLFWTAAFLVLGCLSCGGRSGPDPAAHLKTAPATHLLVPRGTELVVVPHREIGTQISELGETCYVELLEAALDRQGRAALPAGSLLRAEVSRVRRAGRVLLRARLGIKLTEVLPRKGDPLPLHAQRTFKGGSTLLGKGVSAVLVKAGGPLAVRGAAGLVQRGPDLMLFRGEPFSVPLREDLLVPFGWADPDSKKTP